MKKQTELWIMANGKSIRICDMIYSHLINTIKLLNKRHNCNYDMLPDIYHNLTEELQRRDWELAANRRALDRYKRKVCNGNEMQL